MPLAVATLEARLDVRRGDYAAGGVHVRQATEAACAFAPQTAFQATEAPRERNVVGIAQGLARENEDGVVVPGRLDGLETRVVEPVQRDIGHGRSQRRRARHDAH